MTVITHFLAIVAYMFVMGPIAALFLKWILFAFKSKMQDNAAWREDVINEFGQYYSIDQVRAMCKTAEFRGDIYSVQRCNRLLNG